MKRKALSKKLRFEVFKRDGFVCQYCGAHPPAVVLELDHVDPVSNGGADDTDNLVTSCFNCNRGKAARLLTVVPKSLKDKAAEVSEREAQLAGYAAIMESRRQRIEDDVWRVLEILHGPSERVPRDQFQSVRLFVEKIGLHETLDAMEIAMSSHVPMYKVFRYFCGVCWRKARRAGE